MLIRSQDKMKLVNLEAFNEITIRRLCTEGKPLDYWSIAAICFVKHGKKSIFCYLGEYTSKEKALTVLARIYDTYGDYFYARGGALATENFYVQPFGFSQPKIFQMPEDDKVTVIEGDY